MPRSFCVVDVRKPTLIGAFTLIELLTVMVVIMILATMLTSVVVELRGRADQAKCTQNLKNLYTGAAVYVTQQGSWPQISPMKGNSSTFAKAWVEALEPYGISHINWLCPTVQRVLGDPDYTTGNNYRIDYLPNSFDDKPRTPFQWEHQPWFAERGAVHGHGNLMIWTNGQIVTLEEAMQYQ